MNKNKLIWAVVGVVLVAGLVWVIATAPKSEAPQGAPESQTPPPDTNQRPPVNPSGTSGDGKSFTIYLSAPSGGEKWLIGTDHTISWTNAAKITGEITLVQAGTNEVMGWINSMTGADQTSYSWDTRYLYLTRNSAERKTVGQGNYFIRVKFDSASYPVLTSGTFSITTVAQPATTRSVSIQSFVFNPSNTIIPRGGKVTFTNNDNVAHNITFQTSVYPPSPLGPGASVTIDTSVFPPGAYSYYCSIHPSMTGVLTVQ